MHRPSDPRRVYYDHEPAYRKIEAMGGRGWDDLNPGHAGDSYDVLLAFLASPFAPQPGPEVRALDLGCGGGQASALLAARGYTTFSVDYSITAVRLARQNAREAGLMIHLLVGDCLSHLFAAEVMDLVLDNHVLHCLIGARDRRAFLQSAYAVLKPGGILFSDTMSCEGDFDARSVDADPATRIARSHTRYWASRRELEGEFRSAGFRILHQEEGAASPGCGQNIVTYAQRPAS